MNVILCRIDYDQRAYIIITSDVWMLDATQHDLLPGLASADQ